MSETFPIVRDIHVVGDNFHCQRHTPLLKTFQMTETSTIVEDMLNMRDLHRQGHHQRQRRAKRQRHVPLSDTPSLVKDIAHRQSNFNYQRQLPFSET